MAINYTKVGWDTSKYVNPTNMNQMDYGIKAACDRLDEIGTNYTKLTNAGFQTIENTQADDTVLKFKANSAGCYNQYLNNSGTLLGYIGVNSSKKPVFYDTASHEIALMDNVIAKSSTGTQTISTGVSIPLSVKRNEANFVPYLEFANNGGRLGLIGVNTSKKPVFYDTEDHEIALIGSLTVTNGTIDANGDMALSLSSGQYPIMWVRATGANGDRVSFFDGSSNPGLQPYAHFETLRSTTLSGTVIYVEM